MHKKIKDLLDKHFPGEVCSGKLKLLATELDQLLQEHENEITLLERSMDLASDAIIESNDTAANHIELFETTFLSSSEAMLLVDFEQDLLTYNESLGKLLNIPKSFDGEISMNSFLKNLAYHLENPSNFLTFLKKSHDNHDVFEGELLLKDSCWLKYHV
ncbi:MAG: hypothetical protein KC467_09550, partial [Marinomonas atlantica]|nr:hypothetical protein [Marinomonas atlantica]